MIRFQSFTGTITRIEDCWSANKQRLGCTKIISIESMNGNSINFIVSPSTYFVNHVMMEVGDIVIGFYDANAPTPLIFPPQLQAIVMAIVTKDRTVKVDYFNDQLVSSDGTLKLNISPYTPIILENNQRFTENPADRNLIVVYGASTRSIPAQTTPEQIIVIC